MLNLKALEFIVTKKFFFCSQHNICERIIIFEYLESDYIIYIIKISLVEFISKELPTL